jgi:hypothetical protein
MWGLTQWKHDPSRTSDHVGLKCLCMKFEDGSSKDFSTVEIRNRCMPASGRTDYDVQPGRSQCSFSTWTETCKASI